MYGKRKGFAAALSLLMCLSLFFCNSFIVFAQADAEPEVNSAQSAEQIEEAPIEKSPNATADGENEEDKKQTVSEKGETQEKEKQSEVFDKEKEESAEKEKSAQSTKETTRKKEGITRNAREKVTEEKELLKAPQRAVHNDVITKIEALLQDGSGPAEDIEQWQVFRINAEFALPDNKVKAGDTTTITLPEKLRFSQTHDFVITDENGNVVANAAVNGEDKTITLTYTDYPETHSGVKGNFKFYVRIERSLVDGEEDIPLNFDVDGTTVYGGSVHFVGIPDPGPFYLSKSGDPINSRTIQFHLSINTRQEEIKNASVTDLMQSAGFTIDPSSFRIYKGSWEKVHGDWHLVNSSDVTSQYDIKFNEDKTGFSIDLGDIASSDAFQIFYNAVASYDMVDGEKVNNKATLNGSGLNAVPHETTTTYVEAGGSAEGYVYSIKIHKQGEDGEALKGGIFDVIRISTNESAGQITTDENGNGEIKGLLKDRYKIIEIQAPAGYVAPEGEEYLIETDDFNSETKIAFKTIINKPASVSVPVSKAWIGPKKESAAFSIKRSYTRDGITKEEVLPNTLILNDGNGWSGSFDNLEKYVTGTDIEWEYQVEEQTIPGYEAEKEGNQKDGFKFTNKKTETIDIPVEKKWVGKAGNNAIIRLIADDEEIKDVLLDSSKGWKHTFTDLPKYDEKDGHEIKYEIREDPVDGYITGISGTAEDGYTVINTVSGKVSVPVTKIWDGPKTDSVTINLMADGNKVNSIKLSAENNWQYTFADLEKYKNGKEIEYTVQEEKVTDYDTNIYGNAQDGFIIKNTNTKMRSINVTKIWIGSPAEEVTVRLFADGEEIQSAKISAECGWKYCFNNLAVYTSKGDKIEYTLKEDIIEGYSSEIAGNTEKGFTVRNSKKDAAPFVKRKDVPPFVKKKDVAPFVTTIVKKTTTPSPMTGDETNAYGYIIAMFAASVILAVLYTRKRRSG